MLNYNDFLQNAQNTRMDGRPNSYSIKVLIVDHKEDFLAYIGKMLHSCLFEVTCVNHSGAALRLLSENKNKFDLLLIDRDMSDVDVHTFLKLTINMDMLSVVMSGQEDDAFLFEALMNGASHVLTKPISMDALKVIRQEIMRQRIHKHDKCKNTPTQEATTPENRGSSSIKKDRQPSQNHNYRGSVKKKECIAWTEELHGKFLWAVKKLGSRSCVPRGILELMDVPGLTRMQIASHLQKWRKEILRSNKKKNKVTSSWKHILPDNVSLHQEETVGINLSMNEWQNHMNSQTYSSSSMMNISNQNNIENCAQYTPNPFTSSNQYEGFPARAKTTNYFQQELPGVRNVEGLQHHIFPSFHCPAYEEYPDFLRGSDASGPNDI